MRNSIALFILTFLTRDAYLLSAARQNAPSARETTPLVVTHQYLPAGIRRKAMALLLAVTPEGDTEMLRIAAIMAQNLERSGQFKVTIKGFTTPRTLDQLNQLFDKQYPLEIFLSQDDNHRSIGWRIYDVHDGQLVQGKKYAKRGTSLHGYADNLTDELWPELTQQASSFSSKIAYVKRKQSTSKRQRSVVCAANTDGSDEQEFIKTPGTYVSVYWHHDKNNPCLFCSEFTRFNVRLISATPQGKKKIVLNVRGTSVGISISHDNNKAVYCRSGTIWEYRYDALQKQGIHTPLIKNGGKNVSPTLLENGDIIFCSDSVHLRKGHPHARGPQICRYNAQDRSVTLLTTEGYCVGPSYCARNQKIAYSKRIDGIMQLCVYDCRTQINQQLTFDAGKKIDCCWSPCGNFLVFCYQQGRESRIAVMHVVMKKRTFITPAQNYCSCPSWSPVF